MIIGLLAGAGLSVTGLGVVYAIDRKHAAQGSFTPYLHPEYNEKMEQMGQDTARGNTDEVYGRLRDANDIIESCQHFLQTVQKLQNKAGQGANK